MRSVLYKFQRTVTEYSEPVLLRFDPRGTVLEFMGDNAGGERAGGESAGVIFKGVQWFQFFDEPCQESLDEIAYACIVDMGHTESLEMTANAFAKYRHRPEHVEPLKHLRIGADSECWDFICEGFEVFGDL